MVTDSPKTRNIKAPRVQWYAVRTFNTEQDCLAHALAEGFSVLKKMDGKLVIHRYLRCNLVKANGPQCEAKRKLQISNAALGWEYFTNACEHTHDLINNKLAPAMRNKVKLLRQQNIEPHVATGVLVAEYGDDAPSQEQIYNINRQLDKEGKTNFTTLNDLEMWLSSRSEPIRDDDPFVLDYATTHSIVSGEMRASLQYGISREEINQRSNRMF